MYVAEVVDDFCKKGCLRERLATGKRDATVIRTENRRLAIQDRRQLRCRIDPADDSLPRGTLDDLWTGRHAFGIMAPGTAKWTPLEEDGSANSRPIVHCEFANIKDHPGLHTLTLLNPRRDGVR